MPALPDFRLETYFSRWEFAARYNLTASDAQTMSLAELLELADDDGRARGASLHLGYTGTYGLPALPPALTARDDPPAAAGAPRAPPAQAAACAALHGRRIGWIACRDRALLRRLEHAKHYTSICSSAPSEILALIALRARDRILGRNRRIIADNRPVFDAFFSRFPGRFDWEPPQGGCVCFPRYLGPDGVEAMCADLVEQEAILLLPPSVYRPPPTPTPPDRFRS